MPTWRFEFCECFIVIVSKNGYVLAAVICLSFLSVPQQYCIIQNDVDEYS